MIVEMEMPKGINNSIGGCRDIEGDSPLYSNTTAWALSEYFFFTWLTGFLMIREMRAMCLSII